MQVGMSRNYSAGPYPQVYVCPIRGPKAAVTEQGEYNNENGHDLMLPVGAAESILVWEPSSIQAKSPDK